MATRKLSLLNLLRRRCRPPPLISSSLTSSSQPSFTNPSLDYPSPSFFKQFPSSPTPYNFFYSRRSFSTRNTDSHFEAVNLDVETHSDQPSDLGFVGGGGGGGGDGGVAEIAEKVVSASGVESILPVRALISLLDGYHQLTGLPWWIIIASSTLALRIILLPILLLQLNKLKRIAELFPKLPPPLPPPLSGRSFIDQLSLFRKEKRAVGCPSYLWFLAPFSVQVPCFLLWMTSIRRMSLDHHPGFDCGGTLWFQNLTEFPHGVSSPIFPLLIAGLHFANIQISFRSASSVAKANDLFSLLAKYYKLYLDLLSLPIFFVGFCVPQGSLVYWLTNSTLTVVQQMFLNHPAVREKLGLPQKDSPIGAATPTKEMDTEGVKLLDGQGKKQKISAKNLSPRELLALSVQLLAKGHKERAIPLLRLALEKDPEYVRALVILGQTLLQNGLLAEATEYLERAISRLFLVGRLAEGEDADLLIVASQWAGVAYVRQGKNPEGIVHLERVAESKEPDDSKGKSHYYDGLVLLASALYNEGRKTEAANYLRKAVAYNSEYKVYLEQCEKDDDNFVSDLESSRRGDY